MAGQTKAVDIQTSAREVDFVTQFQRNWEHLRDIMGVTRQIRKQPGTVLKSKYASVTLESGAVGEGETIPYSHATVATKDYATINVEKYAKAVTIEAINEHGYNDAVNRTDEEFRYELQQNVTSRFYTFLNTGTLVSAKPGFQAALAEAQAQVRNKWKGMHRSITEVIGWCNLLDAYDYLGAANITVQNQFGMNYIEDFLGYKKLFLCSSDEIARGKVLATPANNMILYYVSPGDSDFSKAGLSYTVQGETPLLGYHVDGKYDNATSVSYAIMGLTLMAEYLDGIAVVTIDDSFLTDLTVSSDAADATYPWTSLTPADFQSDVAVSGGEITGSLKFIEGGMSPSGPLSGDGHFIALKFDNFSSGLTYANVQVGIVPTQGTGLVTLDSDKNAVFKVADNTQSIKTVQTDTAGHTNVQYFSLKNVVLEPKEA